MQSRWSDREADDAVRRGAAAGITRDVALRVHTTRLLGADPRLVLHGGGNTSVKTTLPDLLGRPTEVICVKGSGWDMATIEAPGLPAVRLAPLRDLLALDALSDEDMVNACRTNLLDASAPTPSVEALLHAFLPHAFIDHTHANAVLALSDQPDGAAICAEVYGDRAFVLPYVQPGFELAKRAWAAHEERGAARCAPRRGRRAECEGMILLKHGIFTWGATAREAYERMIALVTLAEIRIEHARRAKKGRARSAGAPAVCASADDVAPIVRGLLGRAEGALAPPRRFVIVHRATPAILDHLARPDLERLAGAGVVTPDHAIRTKPWPLVLPAPRAGALPAFAAQTAAAMGEYVRRYRAYFGRNDHVHGKKALDPLPRVILVPGVGLLAAGASAREAAIAADLAEATIEVIGDAEAVGRFESITEAETFDMEYWSLEQAKLAKKAEPPLARHVAVVTGGAGTIGRAIARAFRAEGAEVALLDVDGAAVAAAAKEVGGLGVACDVTSEADVQRAMASVCGALGGLDVAVSNAGAAWQGRIGEVDDALLRRSFELNFFAHQSVARAAVAIFRAQGFGGTLLFNVSKQAVNPGRDFGPYGLPKAATLALLRQYAVDYGDEGIRACGVNADRIRSGLLTDEMIARRSAARGVSEHDYMAGNLLRREVTADDVARAFVSLALAPSTTGAVITVDGGNIAAALR
jgi:rhamnose utilization protein RhaD (predicted bifunctional aldolase and dehydrogenase)/NAD(P)-dependent dehydrogenase (short-subunit alcohol dehydrogenase family)